ncbi:5-formyltetrahydrofolate cyclo-ligase [Defluviimonas aquaemixtae]|uniref:5-formyltetrahydrofolate cyclo-ligase n=1 Tax=Albidovulum aquaemixtae TaxID=1542388 RepID=A0A2R8B7F8_9RHOB|nr:5-formyltetrahydrofolate cyclo-ligase [Defluviimonas aquaemixtae]SPH18551.1 5-formyltetrahydrofolate cyclo-ligase [Defluviimonas aquaemixtae]
MTLADIKAAARADAFSRRKVAFANRKDSDAARLLTALTGHAGKVLAGYMPMRTEIDCLPAMAAHKGAVGVPVILGSGRPLKFRGWSPEAVMVPGTFGARVPESGDWLVPEVLIVPLLSFDRRGFRLGYGGGFYDRTLEGLRARGPVTAIGFAFAAQEVDEVPIEATDQPLDLIVTEAETIAPGA